MQTKRITGRLPAPTLAQRCASLSVFDLMVAAKALAVKTDAASDAACTAVLEALEKRISAEVFAEFVADIYPAPAVAS